MTQVNGSTFEHILSIVGALVPLFSAIASFFNHKVRVSTNDGRDPSNSLLVAATALNVLSVNIDKAIQLVRLARGESPPKTTLPEELSYVEMPPEPSVPDHKE